MDEKFAVYVLLVEDTAEADERLADAAYEVKRLGGDMTWVEAEDAMEACPVDNTNVAR